MITEPPPRQPGLPGYVQRDWEVVDYECYPLAGSRLWFRGPAPDSDPDKCPITVLGAAQSFGCFVDQPYPLLLSQVLQVDTLNLGYPGAGPAFFLDHAELIDRANGGRMCIVQVMSGRSTSNSAFTNPHGLAVGRRTSDGRPTAAEDLWRDLLAEAYQSFPVVPETVLRHALRVSRLSLPGIQRVVKESKAQWIRDMSLLLDRLTVPTVLLWFSRRTPHYRPRFHTATALLGDFPHLVDDAMIAEVRKRSDHYVEVVTSRGHPQRLMSRFTGQPTSVDLSADSHELVPGSGDRTSVYTGTWHENLYYPSPEMHQDAALALVPACRRVLSAEQSN